LCLKKSPKLDFAPIVLVAIGIALLIYEIIREPSKENFGGKLILFLTFSDVLYWRIKSFWNK
jgi:hypothetical protein